ncbi:MAG: hypothetical protein ACJAV2_004745, partial [Myxococcota bacterium]
GIIGTSFLPRQLRAYSSDRINLTGSGSTYTTWMVFDYGSQLPRTPASNSTRTQTYINGCVLSVDARRGDQRIWPVDFNPAYSGPYTHSY